MACMKDRHCIQEAARPGPRLPFFLSFLRNLSFISQTLHRFRLFFKFRLSLAAYYVISKRKTERKGKTQETERKGRLRERSRT